MVRRHSLNHDKRPNRVFRLQLLNYQTTYHRGPRITPDELPICPAPIMMPHPPRAFVASDVTGVSRELSRN